MLNRTVVEEEKETPSLLVLNVENQDICKGNVQEIIRGTPIEGLFHQEFGLVAKNHWRNECKSKFHKDETPLMGGHTLFFSYHLTSTVIKYEVLSDSAPICIDIAGTAPMGCLSTAYRTFLSDAPDGLPPEKEPSTP